MNSPIPNSPTLPTDDIVTTAKGFSDAMTLDLNDDEIKRSMELIATVRRRYIDRWQYMDFDSVDHAISELEKFRDELSTKLAEELELLVTVDGSPILAGEPPIVEIIGKIEGSQFSKYGMDHELKTDQVQKATDRSEDYLGQKGK